MFSTAAAPRGCSEKFSSTSQLPYYRSTGYSNNDFVTEVYSRHQRSWPVNGYTSRPKKLYFEDSQSVLGAFGDPGTVPPQDVNEPLARDIPFLVRHRYETGQAGPTSADTAAELVGQYPWRYNLNQPLGAIGLNVDRMSKLLIRAEDVNQIYYPSVPNQQPSVVKQWYKSARDWWSR